MKKGQAILCGSISVIIALALIACPDDTYSGGGGSGETLADKLQWLQYAENIENGKTYIITVNADETIGEQTFFYSNLNNVTIILKGSEAERIISLSGSGALFNVYSGVTLILDENITLKGRGGNDNSLVNVGGGAMEMRAGSKITGNSYSRTGGGVYVGNRGTFTMNGGEISGNTVSGGSASGGGVYVSSGTFTMNGGNIFGNTVSGDKSSGGGVTVSGSSSSTGTFIMNGGEISGNTADFGSGVYLSGIFTMNGGKISGNTAASDSAANGGGVFVAGTFVMNSGEISGNTAPVGGGVFVSGSGSSTGTFTMNGGEVSGNTASYGGGVFVNNNGAFRIVTGTIYGSNEGALSNTIDALYIYTDTSPGGTAERGTFYGTTWSRRASLPTTNNTIRVINGNAQ